MFFSPASGPNIYTSVSALGSYMHTTLIKKKQKQTQSTASHSRLFNPTALVFDMMRGQPPAPERAQRGELTRSPVKFTAIETNKESFNAPKSVPKRVRHCLLIFSPAPKESCATTACLGQCA